MPINVNNITIFTICLCCSLGAISNSTTDTVVHYRDIEPYHTAILQAALEGTREEFGSYTLAPTKRIFPPLRIMHEVVSGRNLNVFFAPALRQFSKEELITIPIPLFKGLTGYRILLIRKGEQARFSQITELPQLKDIVFGQPFGWIDTLIMSDNQLKVITSPELPLLYPMLKIGRVDAIARSAHRIQNYLSHPELGEFQSIESDLVLYYSMPQLLFVSANEPELAQRLHIGLEKMTNNGEMDRLFYLHFGELIKELRLNERRVFQIENTQLMDGIPIGFQEFRVDPTENPPIQEE